MRSAEKVGYISLKISFSLNRSTSQTHVHRYQLYVQDTDEAIDEYDNLQIPRFQNSSRQLLVQM